MEGVIFSSTLLLVLYGTAILLSIFDMVKRASGYLFPVLSVIIFTGTTVYALLLGAGYDEVGLVTLIFLLLNLTSYMRRRGGKE